MSALGVQAAPPAMDEPPPVIVIGRTDGSVESHGNDDEEAEEEEEGFDADATLAAERDSDDVTTVGGMTFARTGVQEHPLRLDVHPPSPPLWERGRGLGRACLGKIPVEP